MKEKIFWTLILSAGPLIAGGLLYLAGQASWQIYDKNFEVTQNLQHQYVVYDRESGEMSVPLSSNAGDLPNNLSRFGKVLDLYGCARQTVDSYPDSFVKPAKVSAKFLPPEHQIKPSVTAIKVVNTGACAVTSPEIHPIDTKTRDMISIGHSIQLNLAGNDRAQLIATVAKLLNDPTAMKNAEAYSSYFGWILLLLAVGTPGALLLAGATLGAINDSQKDEGARVRRVKFAREQQNRPVAEFATSEFVETTPDRDDYRVTPKPATTRLDLQQREAMLPYYPGGKIIADERLGLDGEIVENKAPAKSKFPSYIDDNGDTCYIVSTINSSDDFSDAREKIREFVTINGGDPGKRALLDYHELEHFIETDRQGKLDPNRHPYVEARVDPRSGIVMSCKNIMTKNAVINVKTYIAPEIPSQSDFQSAAIEIQKVEGPAREILAKQMTEKAARVVAQLKRDGRENDIDPLLESLAS